MGPFCVIHCGVLSLSSYLWFICDLQAAKHYDHLSSSPLSFPSTFFCCLLKEMKGNSESEKLSVLCFDCCIYSDHVLRLYKTYLQKNCFYATPNLQHFFVLTTTVSVIKMKQSKGATLKYVNE